MAIDRDPLRTIAAKALAGSVVSPASTLEAIFTFTFDQLAQRQGANEIAKLLADLDIADLFPNKDFSQC
jgi:hypothetical protein